MNGPHFAGPFIIDGHLGFHFVAVVNNAAKNIDTQAFMSLLPLGIYLEVEFLAHVVIPCLTLLGSTKFFLVAASSYIPTSSV